jgi:hypothetical protein
MQQRGPHGPVPNVELAVELFVCQFPAAAQQQASGPGIVSQQPVQ